MFITMQLVNIFEGLVHIFRGQFASMRTYYVICSFLLLSVIIYGTVYNLSELPSDLNVRIIITMITSLIIGPFFVSFFVLMKWPRKSWTHNKRIENTESRKFLQIMKLSMDISTEVLRRVVDSRILSMYGGSLVKFLDDEKHYLFHQWQGSVPCCKCPPAGCTMVKSKKLKAWLFKNLFTDNGTPIKDHLKKYGHRISKYCLHCFVTNSDLKVDNLDITILAFLIEHFASLSSKEISAFKDIVFTRNSICHAWKTSCFDSKELENMWILLSDASLTLIDSPYKNLLRDQIKTLKKVEFDDSDVELLREKLEHEEKMLVEIFEFINQNSITKDYMKETEERIISRTEDTRRCVEDGVGVLKEGQMTLLSQQKKTDDKLGIVAQQINGLISEFHLFAENNRETKNNEKGPTERSIAAVLRIDDNRIDDESVVENIMINTQTGKDTDTFVVVSAKQSCIILNLVCSPNVLKDEQSLQFALKSILCDIVEAGKIDTEASSTIAVQIKFCSPLTEKEVHVLKNTVSKDSHLVFDRDPREIDTKGSIGLKMDCETLDVYKISSTSKVVISKSDPCVIVLTEDSYIPDESDIKVMIWDTVNNSPVVVTPKVIKNVIEFYIPWNNVSLFTKSLYISLHDGKRRKETSKLKLVINIPSESISKSCGMLEREQTIVKMNEEEGNIIEHALLGEMANVFWPIVKTILGLLLCFLFWFVTIYLMYVFGIVVPSYISNNLKSIIQYISDCAVQVIKHATFSTLD